MIGILGLSLKPAAASVLALLPPHPLCCSLPAGPSASTLPALPPSLPLLPTQPTTPSELSLDASRYKEMVPGSVRAREWIVHKASGVDECVCTID